MKSYLSLVPKYLKAHKKKTRLIIASVAISVSLVTGIFSMLDFFQQFEVLQQIHENGNYHLSIKNATDEEKLAAAARIDVKNSGTWISFRRGTLGGKVCRIDAMDESIAPNMQFNLKEGRYPMAENEVALEEWAAGSLHLKPGDTAKVIFADKTEKEYILSGICGDYPNTKAGDTPVVLLSVAGANAVNAEKASAFLLEFKKGVNVNAAQKELRDSLHLEEGRIGRNEYLLAAMGQSTSNKALSLYVTGAVLFCIVLIAGVMMIYNTFNLSVMERVRQFGLLKCIGASRRQIRKMIMKEGFSITVRAIPIGVLAGMLLAILCSAILKFYNNSYFGEIALFNVSIIGTAAGIMVGFLTVLIASSLPARKAARVSPVNAATGSNELKMSKKKKQGLLMKLLHAEIAMGMNNAVIKRKTLILMSCSIAISIVMFLGFQVFIDFTHASMKTSKPYTPDVSLISEKNLSNKLYEEVSAVDGVNKAYARMFSYAEAAFNASRLTPLYKESMGGISETSDGLFVPPEKSWLISYDEDQLEWAKEDLVEGELSEDKLNEHNGVIAVAFHLRNNISSKTATLKLGDKVYVKTPKGTKQMTVMAVLRSVPFNSPQLALTTFITTEKLFTELTGEKSYKIIDLQLKRSGQEETLDEIRSMLDSSVSLKDQRQKNSETDQAFMTMAVFIYGFVAVIALISILNIINTMNTSVASKIQYLGVLRAVGMDGGQLDRMIFAEAATYALAGSVTGCILGMLLQNYLITSQLSYFNIVWKVPYAQIVLILAFVLLIAAASVIGPLKRIKARGITETIGSL